VTCAACGAGALRPALRVAGEGGAMVPTTDRFGVALADFVRCQECGHLQLESMPDVASEYEEAESDAYELEEEGQRATAAGVMERIERHARGCLLDYGCWVGFLASEAAERGWAATGVEPSRWAAERARSRGVEVVDSPEGPFDAIAMGDVIEHLPDPGAALDQLAALLAPGGVVWIATPDAGSRVARLLGPRWWSVIPTHLHLFNRRSLSRLLERHGFEVLAMRTSPKTFTVAYYLSRLGGYWPPLGRGLVAIAGAARVADRLWTPDFRDRFEVVAQRAQAPPQPSPPPAR
jgi:SAM-dependent methyltransferase